MTSQLIEKEELAKINDQNRSAFKRSVDFQIAYTFRVFDSPNFQNIIDAVKKFNDFNEGDDPYGEHDFGAFVLDGIKYFWRIDYFDEDFQYGADPYTQLFYSRLTIMEAEEY